MNEAGGWGPGTRGQVVVVGQGYVGLPVAMAACEVGWQVLGFDLDETKIGLLQAGISPVEDISAEVLGAALESGRYRATTDPSELAGFDIAVVTVPTPLSEGMPDLSFIGRPATRCRST
jgi:UDP-N-acetyl-D-glucosamine dehydrogenase